MSQTSIDAGKLNQPVEILTIQESPAGTWSWQSTRPARAQVELSTRSNLFSQVGIGARGAELVLRRQALTLHQAILWGEQHLFLTAILPEGRLHLRVQAALVSVDTVTLQKDENTVEKTFPGVLTEKYARHEQEWPMSLNQLGLVLVVPKAITLEPGRLVKARGALWEVLVPHELDPYKNEYEIGRTVDL